jgi:hypothetical protein
MHSSSCFVLGIEVAPGADGCITERNLNEESFVRVGDSSRADIVGTYDEIT